MESMPRRSTLYLKERLELYRLVHIWIGLAQKSADLFFRQNLMDASELLHYRGQIFYCYMLCVRSLCSDKLLWQKMRGRNVITVDCHQNLDVNGKLLWLLTFVLRVRSCTWVNWLCSPGSETRTPKKVDIVFQFPQKKKQFLSEK